MKKKDHFNKNGSKILMALTGNRALSFPKYETDIVHHMNLNLELLYIDFSDDLTFDLKV